MVAACLTYAETGLRETAFGGWHVALDGGGVCNGDPVCEDDDMTFVAPGASGTGEVRVAVGAADRFADLGGSETVVGDAPAHLTCRSADGVRHTTAEVRRAHGALVARALAEARWIEGCIFSDVLSGPYLGCGHDGRPYQVEFSLHRAGPAVLRLYYPAREGAAEGVVPSCVRVIG